MGISTKTEVERKKTLSAFVDSMADDNYIKVGASRPVTTSAGTLKQKHTR